MQYHRAIVQEVSIHIIIPLARIVADYVTPINPTDRQIGVYDISPLVSLVKNRNEYLVGLGFGGHVNNIKNIHPYELDNILEGACEKGDMESINALLIHPIKLNKGLIGACRGNHTKIALMMLDRGANIRAFESIAEACEHNNLDLAQILVKRGASPSHGIANACKHKYRSIIDYLLSRGADINSALSGACEGRHTDLIIEFLNKGANPDQVVSFAYVTKNTELINFMKSKYVGVYDK